MKAPVRRCCVCHHLYLPWWHGDTTLNLTTLAGRTIHSDHGHRYCMSARARGFLAPPEGEA